MSAPLTIGCALACRRIVDRGNALNVGQNARQRRRRAISTSERTGGLRWSNGGVGAPRRQPLGETNLVAARDLCAELLGQHRLPDLASRPFAKEALRVFGQHGLDEALQHKGLEL